MGTIITARSMVLSGTDHDAAKPLTHARIGYHNILEGASIDAAAGGDAGFPATALLNSLTYELYRPALSAYIGYPVPDPVPADIIFDTGALERTANYLGVAAHSLGSTKTMVTFSVAPAFAGPYVDFAEFIPADDKPVMVLFDEAQGSHWRLRITPPEGEQPHIGALYIGMVLPMQRALYGGHTPLSLSRVTAIRPHISETGHFIGRSIVRKGLRTSFAWSHLTPDWYRARFDPFVVAALIKPWFISWRPASYPGEVAYCWTTSDIAPSNMGKGNLMEVSVAVEAIDV